MMPLVLTMGEPAGVAPEIAAQAWLALRNDLSQQFCLIGDANVFEARAKASGFDVSFVGVERVADCASVFARGVPVLHRPLPVSSVAGKLDARNSAAVIAAIDEAVRLCLSGEASGMVTNPIQKETLYDVGFKHQGHTDYLAYLAKASGREVMMLVGEGLRAIPVTVHIPLADVPKALTTEAIVTQGKVVAESLKQWFGIARPRLAVTA
jgi:4-hydroxythreonine-4-phosphate dehydrogenase